VLRPGALLCKDGASFYRIHVYGVIARPRELLVVAEAYAAECEVALDPVSYRWCSLRDHTPRPLCGSSSFPTCYEKNGHGMS
jgi:hypothetical protein